MARVAESTELKGLKTHKLRIEAELKLAKDEARMANEKIRNCQEKLAGINDRIEQLTKHQSDIVVTEHAVLRYLEKVKGVDIEAIKSEILTPELIQRVNILGNVKQKMTGYTVVVRDRTVVTVIARGDA